jgi:spore germination protein KA
MFRLFKKRKPENSKKDQETKSRKTDEVLKKSLEKNISLFKGIFKNDETLIIREFQNKRLRAAKCCILYIEGMVNTEMIAENIIKPILHDHLPDDIESHDLFAELKNKVIISNRVSNETAIDKIVSSVIGGDTLFLLEGYAEALIIDSKGWQTRQISEPESAKAVRGPREGFTESIIVNLSLTRRKIKNPDLKFRFKEIGERTHTRTCICYIEGLALDSVLKELEKRLNDIDIDGIMDSGYIQELIKDAPFSPFETIGFSERPDVIAAKLLEGRIALFVDGSPFVLTVPYVVAENFQANEDYYNNYIISSINRLIRGITAVTTITIPAIFLSIASYHQEMMPTPMLLSLSASRQDVPIPTALSLFLMLFIFDVIREATTRMPVHISEAITIIGTIILGQAAVEARLVSAPVLIVTALTGITTLINMNFLSAAIIFRNFLLLGAAFLGIYGFVLCFIIMYLHLMSMRSFGVPYMMNVTKAKNYDGQDAWIRAPWWAMTLRPKIIGMRNLVRQSPAKNKRKQ